LLIEIGVLSKIDMAALAAYCAAYSRWYIAEKNLTEDNFIAMTKQGNTIQNPYIGISNKAAMVMHKFLVEFGLTPVSRMRIQSAPQDKEADSILD
jgi:P27 family predicted phage terminase small subunit